MEPRKGAQQAENKAPAHPPKISGTTPVKNRGGSLGGSLGGLIRLEYIKIRLILAKVHNLSALLHKTSTQISFSYISEVQMYNDACIHRIYHKQCMYATLHARTKNGCTKYKFVCMQYAHVFERAGEGGGGGRMNCASIVSILVGGAKHAAES